MFARMLDEEMTSSSSSLSAPVYISGASFSKTQKCCKVKLQRRNLPSRRRLPQTWKSPALDPETPGEAPRRPEQGDRIQTRGPAVLLGEGGRRKWKHESRGDAHKHLPTCAASTSCVKTNRKRFVPLRINSNTDTFSARMHIIFY